MSHFNSFALLDSDEEENVAPVTKPQKASKPKPEKTKKAPAPSQNGSTPQPPPAAGSGWDAAPATGKQDVENKMRTDNRMDNRRGGRGGRGGTGGRNGRDFDRRSGTGRGREMKKGGAGGHNWGIAEAEQEEPAPMETTDEPPAEGSGWGAAPEANAENSEAQAETAAAEPTDPVEEKVPPKPEIQQLTLDEFEAQKAAKAKELAEQNELFEEREEVQVDQEDLKGLTLKEE